VATAALSDVDSATPAGSRLAALGGWLGGVALGLVLLVAAALKSLDPAGFAEEISRQGVGFGLSPTVVALGALAIEAAVGAALLLNLRSRSVLAAATLLVLFFLFLTGRDAWRAAHGELDAAGSCGCFGALVERTPNEAFVQDLLLLAPALALAWLGRSSAAARRPDRRLRWTIAGLLAAAVVGLAAAAPSLPLDDYATRLRPGSELAELCAGTDAARICLDGLVPALASGTHLVVIADAESAGFASLGARLNAYVRSGAEPPLTVLADLTPERRQALFWELAPAFDLQEVPRALTRPLYRQLPRSFRVEDGRVTATWSGLPPEIPDTPPATR